MIMTRDLSNALNVVHISRLDKEASISSCVTLTGRNVVSVLLLIRAALCKMDLASVNRPFAINHLVESGISLKKRTTMYTKGKQRIQLTSNRR